MPGTCSRWIVCRRALILFSALAVLSGCADSGLSPADRAELDNMWKAFLVPKSSAAQMVTAFDDFCVKTPRGGVEAALRDARYVPLPDRTEGARAWVVDNYRPAVAVSDKMCVVRAKARTGQTNAFQQYIAEQFPDARPVTPALFGEDIEEAWQVSDKALVATERRRDIDFFIYSLIYYTPEVA